MKKNSIFLSAILLVASMTGKSQDNLSVSPGKPHPGDVVKFTYTPPAALAGEKDPLSCVVYKMGNYNDFFGLLNPIGKPVEMQIKKTGASYTGEVNTDPEGCGLVFCFSWGNLIIDRQGVCTSGKMDNNDRKGYFIPLYTGDNKPCATAYARMANYLSVGFFNNLKYKNLPLARKYYLTEMENYPEKSSSLALELASNTFDRKADSAELRNFASSQLERIFGAGPATDADYQACATFFWVLGLKKTAGYFNDYASRNGLAGYFRAEKLWDKTEKEADIDKKRILLDSTISCFKSMDFYQINRTTNAGELLPGLVDNYLVAAYKSGNKKVFDDALAYVQQSTKCGFDQFYPYKAFMQASLELKNYDEAFKISDTYFSICKQKYELLKSNPSAFKPAKGIEEYMKKAQIRSWMVNEMADLTKTAALFYSEKGDCPKALAKLKEYSQYMSYPEMIEYGGTKNIEYVNVDAEISSKCKPLDEAIRSLEKIISNGTYNENIVRIFKELYLKKNGSDKGFNDYLLGLKKTDEIEMAKKLETLKANEVAPDFTLTDMDGRKVKLSDLKGKTVILDFWATWCGPCRASFPAMQQLTEYYKNNPDVVFLFLDTFEDKTGGNTLDKMKEGARKAVTDNNFSFHVLFDLGNEIVTKYKVNAIPAKFVIDKNGMIRYKAVGGGIFSALIDEMMAMIESVK